ncbi:MAG: acyl-CoA dehydrogenase family protein [Desulfobacterales bacterium]|nr:acyl-CoA dehydrogenase family protein [Desulfobacterales bacterium]
MTDHSMTERRFPEKMADFAKTRILTCPGLGEAGEFPEEIWAAMGKEGLLDPDLLRATGTFPCAAIAAAARTMVSSGGNLGLALSWMIHHLVAGVLVRPCLVPGSSFREGCSWARPLWEKVKAGRTTISLAVSEPDAGAHPKFMAARAETRDDHILLSGEKTYLTNGPIARAFCVIAVTGEREGRKEFSAFLADRDTPGLTVSAPMALPFFRPAPHGSIVMEDCRVEKERLLGREGKAFPDLVLPFRQFEDAVMTGPVTGAMGFILGAVARQMAGSSTAGSGDVTTLGSLRALIDSAVFLSDRMAAMAGQGGTPLERLVLFFRQIAARFLETVDTLLTDTGIVLNGPAGTLFRDLKSSSRIGGTVARIRQQKLGQALMDQYAATE